MNFLLEFIKRNIFTIVIIVTLCVAMPWLGYIIALPIIFVAIIAVMISWRLHKLQRQMRDEAGRAGHQHSGANGSGWYRRKREEGEVTVVQTEQTEQKVSDDVGEYVDFKEIKDSEKQ